MDHAGAIVGPLLAMAFLSYYPDDYRSLFLWTLVPGVIALFFIGAAKEDLVRKSEPVGQVGKASWRELPGVLRKYFVCLGFFSLANSTDAFLIISLKDLGVSTAHISLWWAMLHVVKMLSSFAAPFVIGKVGTRNSILFGWGLFSGVYFLFASLDSAPILICAFLIYGIFYGLTEIPERSFIAKMASENRRGAAFGIYAMTLGLSVLPASLMFGAIWQGFGYATAFLVSGTLALLASLMLAFRLPNV